MAVSQEKDNLYCVSPQEFLGEAEGGSLSSSNTIGNNIGLVALYGRDTSLSYPGLDMSRESSISYEQLSGEEIIETAKSLDHIMLRGMGAGGSDVQIGRAECPAGMSGRDPLRDAIFKMKLANGFGSEVTKDQALIIGVVMSHEGIENKIRVLEAGSEAEKVFKESQHTYLLESELSHREKRNIDKPEVKFSTEIPIEKNDSNKSEAEVSLHDREDISDIKDLEVIIAENITSVVELGNTLASDMEDKLVETIRTSSVFSEADEIRDSLLVESSHNNNQVVEEIDDTYEPVFSKIKPTISINDTRDSHNNKDGLNFTINLDHNDTLAYDQQGLIDNLFIYEGDVEHGDLNRDDFIETSEYDNDNELKSSMEVEVSDLYDSSMTEATPELTTDKNVLVTLDGINDSGVELDLSDIQDTTIPTLQSFSLSNLDTIEDYDSSKATTNLLLSSSMLTSQLLAFPVESSIDKTNRHMNDYSDILLIELGRQIDLVDIPDRVRLEGLELVASMRDIRQEIQEMTQSLRFEIIQSGIGWGLPEELKIILDNQESLTVQGMIDLIEQVDETELPFTVKSKYYVLLEKIAMLQASSERLGNLFMISYDPVTHEIELSLSESITDPMSERYGGGLKDNQDYVNTDMIYYIRKLLGVISLKRSGLSVIVA